VGADFRFEPPRLEPFPLPSISIVGTGKRVGKTAVAAHVAQLYARDRKVVVVAMGRGGPPEPEVMTVRPDVGALLELSRSGRHAASDYLETAALAGVETVGCRRCGGGLAGAVAVSNVADGARLAVELAPDLVVFDGSGAAIPPVQTRRRILVVNAQQDPEVVTGYLNDFRHRVSDLVVLTMAEEGTGWQELRDRAAALGPPVVATTLRPRPVKPVSGRRVAFFSTAPDSAHERLAVHLGEEHGADVVHVSGNLADRGRLREELERVDADVFLVELKAAAIDVVAEAARERGVEVVLAGSDVTSAPGEPDLDRELLRLAKEAADE
jgi:cyclic 2,3-diphosphoglycerate synthetase